MKASSIRNKLMPFLAILFWIFVWMIASHIKNEKLVLPYPYDTFKSFLYIISTKEFYIGFVYTILRALVGFTISTILGIIIGFLCGLSNIFYELFLPLITTIKSTPIISIVFILILTFGTNKSPIFVNFLISFPIIWSNVVEGIKNVDTQLLQMAKVYKIKKWRIIYSIYLPSINPYLKAALLSSLGIGWKATITAEALSQPKFAIGTNLLNAKMYIETSEVFAWTISIIIFSYLLEKILKFMGKKLLYWRKKTYGSAN